MAISPTKNTLQACDCRAAASKQFTTECRLKAENGAIAKVLSVHADAVIGNKEVLTGETAFEGELCCRVLYIDGEGVRKVLRSCCPFSERMATETSPTDHVLLRACVVDAATVKVETDSITIKGIIEVSAVTVSEVSMEGLSDGGEGVYTKTEEIVCDSVLGASENTIDVVGDKEADVDGDLLMTDTYATVSSVTPRVDGYVLEGTVVSNVVFKSMDGQLKNLMFGTPFCEEVPIAGINGDAVVLPIVRVKDAQYYITRADGVPTAIQVKAQLTVSSVACMPKSMTVVSDAFKPGVRLDMEVKELCYGRCSMQRATRNIQGTAEMDEGLPALDEVLGVTAARVNVAGVYGVDGKSTAEGVLAASVLYYNKEYGTVNSVAVEVPFSVTLDVSGDSSFCHAVVTDISAKSLRTGKIDLAAEVRFEFCVCEKICKKIVVDLEESVQDEESDAGITVWLATPGMNLWDVAKGLNVAPEKVLNENPETVFPTVGGERILLYRPLGN